MASDTWASGYVLSITGVMVPSSMNCFRSCRSSLFGFTVKLAIFWLTNGDNTIALMTRATGPIQQPSDSPLLITRVPLEVSALLHPDGERVPANWKMRSYFLPRVREVILGVVDDVLCAQRSDHLHVPRAAHATHLGIEGLGDLYGEGPHASRGADDQDLVPWLDPSLVAQSLQGCGRGQGYGRHLLEREGGWFRCQEILRDTYPLSKCAKSVH